MGARIAIIVHERTKDFWTSEYFLRLLAEAWRASGLEIAVVSDPVRFVDADVAILHVDLSIIPDEYLALARRYPVAINGTARDISKRVISTHLLARGDAWTGPVIVKTDRNFGGRPEERLAPRRSLSERLARRVRQHLPLRWGGHPDPRTYPVFESPQQVPERVWNDPRLVVERFLPERRDGLYCLRQWTFFGDGEVHRLVRSHQPVIKANATGERLDLGPAPHDLRMVRERVGFDFGKFDYAEVGGEVVLYDVNRTPYFSRRTAIAHVEATVRAIAPGIQGFLDSSTKPDP